MSGEQRVTDQELSAGIEIIETREGGAFMDGGLAVALDLRDERTAHRATEAKLRAMTLSRDQYRDESERWKREASSSGAVEQEERRLKEAAEAKLRAALVEVERLKADIDRRRLLANEDGVTIQTAWKRATAAESALAATKAKLEAAREELQRISDRHPNAETSAEHYAGYMARRGLQASALTTQGDTDETTV